MPNFVLGMCFNGSGYHGWQMQKNALSIEEILSSAILKITGEKSVITGCSRTDACVHALYYVCNFKSETSIPTEKIPLALNTALPDDIRVNRCAVLDDSFHARFSALSKTYIYKAYTARIANPFLKDFAYHFPYEIDFEKIKNAAAYFVGSHDFSAFMASGGSQKTTVRTVTELEVTRQGDEIHFTITADGYLYNMVRIIAGTLLYVGIGKIKSDEIPEIIKSGDRRRSGITAGAQGLYLARVVYPDSYGVFKDWPQGRL